MGEDDFEGLDEAMLDDALSEAAASQPSKKQTKKFRKDTESCGDDELVEINTCSRK
jgi:hypothetical protein